MSDESIIKKYPASTPQVAQMLGLGADSEFLPAAESVPRHVLPVANLPIEGSEPHEAKDTAAPSHQQAPDGVDEGQPHQAAWMKAGKAALPYLALFVVGLFLYYFFFTGINLNFSAIFKSAPQAVTPKETALQTLERQNMAGYQAWINSYYYDVSDPKITDPDTDNSGNGLSNFQKYLLGLNPKAYDSLGLGMADSQALANGINPLTGGPITDKQKNILSQYVDMEVVMNRLTLSNMQRAPQIAGAGTSASGGSFGAPANSQGGVANSQTGGHLTAPVTGADLSPALDAETDINTAIPGRLEIPDLKINVPIIWSTDPKNFDTDLQSGVIHYPGTALPGQIGTTYIAGHSSNYPWAKGSYNRVFSTLGNLADNTSFKITVVNSSGKDVIYNYVVVKSQQYLPTDQAQFQNTGDSLVALSTCWPVNTTSKRLVVFGKLTQVVN